MSRQVEQAAKAVAAAWTDPGPQPGYHEAWKSTVRENWPELARNLDRLTGAVLRDEEGQS